MARVNIKKYEINEKTKIAENKNVDVFFLPTFVLKANVHETLQITYRNYVFYMAARRTFFKHQKLIPNITGKSLKNGVRSPSKNTSKKKLETNTEQKHGKVKK